MRASPATSLSLKPPIGTAMRCRRRTKTTDQLDLQSLHRVRERFVGQRTGIINQIHAFMLERGIAGRQGIAVPADRASRHLGDTSSAADDLIRYPNMVSQAFSASVNVRKGEPATFMAHLF